MPVAAGRRGIVHKRLLPELLKGAGARIYALAGDEFMGAIAGPQEEIANRVVAATIAHNAHEIAVHINGWPAAVAVFDAAADLNQTFAVVVRLDRRHRQIWDRRRHQV